MNHYTLESLDPYAYDDANSFPMIHLKETLSRSDVVIADLGTGNANVLYEIGLAEGLRKPIALIVRLGETSLPFDLRGYRYLVYDPTDLSSFKWQLSKWVEDFVTRYRRSAS